MQVDIDIVDIDIHEGWSKAWCVGQTQYELVHYRNLNLLLLLLLLLI